MLFIENIKLALTAIKSNKLRSFLTMLGIIIGISSVIAITSIGNSAKGEVSKQFEGVGAGYLYIMQNWKKLSDDGYIDSSTLFTWDEINALSERFSEVEYTSPYFSRGGFFRAGKVKANVSIQGVNAKYEKFYKSITMKYGRMVNESDVEKRKNTIVVDTKMAQKLYNRENIIGEKITLEGKEGSYGDYLVVGIFEVPDSIFSKLSMGEPTYNCYAPYTVVAEYDGEPSSYVEVFLDPECDINATGKRICEWYEKIKDQEKDTYMAQTAESQLTQINQVLGVISLAIGAIAAISLLVGGIGIMNIMLVSVTERTREIGIRKSLGARTKDILTQFLIEAMILSVIGGIIGLLLGLGIAGIGMTIAGVGLIVSPAAIGFAIVFSAGVGLLFGILPAKKAAKLDPIEALRYE